MAFGSKALSPAVFLGGSLPPSRRGVWGRFVSLRLGVERLMTDKVQSLRVLPDMAKNIKYVCRLYLHIVLCSSHTMFPFCMHVKSSSEKPVKPCNSFVSVLPETGMTSGLMAWNCGLLLGLVDVFSGPQGRLLCRGSRLKHRSCHDHELLRFSAQPAPPIERSEKGGTG